MQMGWIDYVVPQNYFEFDYWRTTEDRKTYEVVNTPISPNGGRKIAAETGTKLYMGQGLYRYRDEGNWSNPRRSSTSSVTTRITRTSSGRFSSPTSTFILMTPLPWWRRGSN